MKKQKKDSKIFVIIKLKIYKISFFLNTNNLFKKKLNEKI